MAETDTETKPITAKDVRQLFEMYHVPTTSKAIEGIVGETGEMTPEKFTAVVEHVKRQAAGLYPTWAPEIMAGAPVSDLLEPYRQIGKQVLGDDFEPNFQTDPKMRTALEGGTDPTTGRATPMPLSKWTQYLKSEPSLGYQDTPQGQADRQQVLTKIHSALSGEQ